MARAPGFAKHPDHSMSIEPAGATVKVVFNGEIIAESANVLRLREADYPPVFYLPINDVRSEVMKPTDHKTYCPFKGEARYWSLATGGKTAENAVWGYDAPYDEAAAIAGHVAFYENRVDAIIAE